MTLKIQVLRLKDGDLTVHSGLTFAETQRSRSFDVKAAYVFKHDDPGLRVLRNSDIASRGKGRVVVAGTVMAAHVDARMVPRQGGGSRTTGDGGVGGANDIGVKSVVNPSAEIGDDEQAKNLSEAEVTSALGAIRDALNKLGGKASKSLTPDQLRRARAFVQLHETDREAVYRALRGDSQDDVLKVGNVLEYNNTRDASWIRRALSNSLLQLRGEEAIKWASPFLNASTAGVLAPKTVLWFFAPLYTACSQLKKAWNNPDLNHALMAEFTQSHEMRRHAVKAHTYIPATLTKSIMSGEVSLKTVSLSKDKAVQAKFYTSLDARTMDKDSVSAYFNTKPRCTSTGAFVPSKPSEGFLAQLKDMKTELMNLCQTHLYGPLGLKSQLMRLDSVYKQYNWSQEIKNETYPPRAGQHALVNRNVDYPFQVTSYLAYFLTQYRIAPDVVFKAMRTLPEKPSEWMEHARINQIFIMARNNHSEEGFPFGTGVKKGETEGLVSIMLDDMYKANETMSIDALEKAFPGIFLIKAKLKAEMNPVDEPYQPYNGKQVVSGAGEAFVRDNSRGGSKGRTIYATSYAAEPLRLLLGFMTSRHPPVRGEGLVKRLREERNFSLSHFSYVDGSFDTLVRRITGEKPFTTAPRNWNMYYSDNIYCLRTSVGDSSIVVPYSIMRFNPNSVPDWEEHEKRAQAALARVNAGMDDVDFYEVPDAVGVLFSLDGKRQETGHDHGDSIAMMNALSLATGVPKHAVKYLRKVAPKIISGGKIVIQSQVFNTGFQGSGNPATFECNHAKSWAVLNANPRDVTVEEIIETAKEYGIQYTKERCVVLGVAGTPIMPYGPCLETDILGFGVGRYVPTELERAEDLYVPCLEPERMCKAVAAAKSAENRSSVAKSVAKYISLYAFGGHCYPNYGAIQLSEIKKILAEGIESQEVKITSPNDQEAVLDPMVADYLLKRGSKFSRWDILKLFSGERVEGELETHSMDGIIGRKLDGEVTLGDQLTPDEKHRWERGVDPDHGDATAGPDQEFHDLVRPLEKEDSKEEELMRALKTSRDKLKEATNAFIKKHGAPLFRMEKRKSGRKEKGGVDIIFDYVKFLPDQDWWDKLAQFLFGIEVAMISKPKFVAVRKSLSGSVVSAQMLLFNELVRQKRIFAELYDGRIYYRKWTKEDTTNARDSRKAVAKAKKATTGSNVVTEKMVLVRVKDSGEKVFMPETAAAFYVKGQKRAQVEKPVQDGPTFSVPKVGSVPKPKPTPPPAATVNNPPPGAKGKEKKKVSFRESEEYKARVQVLGVPDGLDRKPVDRARELEENKKRKQEAEEKKKQVTLNMLGMIAVNNRVSQAVALNKNDIKTIAYGVAEDLAKLPKVMRMLPKSYPFTNPLRISKKSSLAQGVKDVLIRVGVPDDDLISYDVWKAKQKPTNINRLFWTVLYERMVAAGTFTMTGVPGNPSVRYGTKSSGTLEDAHEYLL